MILQLTAGQRILLALEPADFRKDIDSLAALCKAMLEEDQLCSSGKQYCLPEERGKAIFEYIKVFYNRQ